MALIYPVLADAPEPDDETAPDFAELAGDLSDQWLVEVAVGDEGDDACFGPLAAHLAWDLALELEASARSGRCRSCRCTWPSRPTTSSPCSRRTEPGAGHREEVT